MADVQLTSSDMITEPSSSIFRIAKPVCYCLSQNTNHDTADITFTQIMQSKLQTIVLRILQFTLTKIM